MHVEEKVFPHRSRAIGAVVRCARAFRTTLRLIAPGRRVRIALVPSRQPASVHKTVHTAVHRFEETIGGRTYHIEVAPTDSHRWRAYIVRVPGVPTALMPFYGPTPDQAAANLREWLTRAHARAATGPKAPAHA
jgi:hypothetical protein